MGKTERFIDPAVCRRAVTISVLRHSGCLATHYPKPQEPRLLTLDLTASLQHDRLVQSGQPAATSLFSYCGSSPWPRIGSGHGMPMPKEAAVLPCQVMSHTCATTAGTRSAADFGHANRPTATSLWNVVWQWAEAMVNVAVVRWFWSPCRSNLRPLHSSGIAGTAQRSPEDGKNQNGIKVRLVVVI
jgi:hypothetical protein